jgi:dipeptidyl aminopeptidase/acylaminoacyl peptidase
MINRFLRVLAVLMLATAAGRSQQTASRAMTVDDVLNMSGVSDPEISPDGKWVVFTRSDLDWKKNRRQAHLWIASTETGRPFQFTSEDGDSAPRWAPDSKSVAFLRGRPEPQSSAQAQPGPDAASSEGRQVWLINTDGGEAVKLSSHKGGIQNFRWSADGKRIFFLAKQARSDDETRKIKGGDDAIYVDEDSNGQGRDQWSELWNLESSSHKERKISKDKLIISSFDPSPDGSRIAIVARRENTRNGIDLSEVYLMDAGTGTLTRLTNNLAPESDVQWAPDGKRLAYLAPDDKKWELASPKIWLIDPETKAYTNVSGRFPGTIGYYCWAGDSRHILFGAQEGTSRKIYQLDLSSGRINRRTGQPGVFAVSSFNADRTMASGVYSTPAQPPEVWVSDLNGREKRLTGFNLNTADFALGSAQIVNWKSKDGLVIEGILYLPSDRRPGTRVPLIVSVHGGPAGSFSYGFSGIDHVYTGLGYAVFCPNVRGSSGYGDAMLRANMHDLGGGDYRDLMSGVDYLIDTGIADPDRIGIRGWSYGGILGGWAITQTNRFKAASLGAMVANWAVEYSTAFNFDVRLWYIGGSPWDNAEGYRRESPYSFVQNVTTPTLILHGEQDTTDPISESMMFYQALKERGVTVRFIRFPREPHGFREPHHQRIRDVEEIAWIQKYVRGIEWKCDRPNESEDSKSDQKEP